MRTATRTAAKVTVGAQNGASVGTSGTATHIVLATGGGTDLIRRLTICGEDDDGHAAGRLRRTSRAG